MARLRLTHLFLAIPLIATACSQIEAADDHDQLTQVKARVLQGAASLCGPSTALPAPMTLPSAPGQAANVAGRPQTALAISPGAPAHSRPQGTPATAPESAAGPGAPALPQALGAIRFELSPARKLHASTNGERIRITRGMIDFLSDDGELAFILAHEAGHILLGHGTSVSNAERRRQELEADQLALIVIDRAGYPLDAGGRFLSRLAGAFPTIRANHPHYPDVALRLDKLRAQALDLQGPSPSAEPPFHARLCSQSVPS